MPGQGRCEYFPVRFGENILVFDNPDRAYRITGTDILPSGFDHRIPGESVVTRSIWRRRSVRRDDPHQQPMRELC